MALKAADDTAVTLEGVLIRKLVDETYEFKDATGIVRAEIDDEEFSVGQPVGSDTRVRLFGEVDRGLGSIEIDVKRMEVL